MKPGSKAADTVFDTVADERRASWFGRLTFGWLLPLIRLGFKRHLTEADIGTNVPRDQVETYLAQFEERLHKGSPNNIGRTIWATFSHNEGSAVVLKLIGDACLYIPPICISYIVSYAQDMDKWTDAEIFIVATAMLVAPMITGLCNHWWYQFVMIDGLHARCTIQAAVYSKVLRISNSARTRSTKEGGVADTIVNLQSTDCRAIESVYWMWIYTWAAPLQVVITTVLLYYELGAPALGGIGVLVMLIPVQKYVMRSLKSLTKAAAKSSDHRIKLITEIIHGVQVVKLQAWESLFAARVEEARHEELRRRRHVAYLNAVNAAISESASIVSTVVAFVIFGAVSDNPLTAGQAFTTLALFNVLRTPIMVLPFLINTIAGGLVAAKRLANFLYAADIHSYVQYSPTAAQSAVVVKHCVFEWGVDSRERSSSAPVKTDDVKAALEEQPPKDGDHSTFTLTVDDFELRPGTMTVVTGKVGSGKSSFLSAILGGMRLRDEGGGGGGGGGGSAARVELRGRVAFCSQEPWIQNATLRGNILFGEPFDAARYAAVLGACALEEDIRALPAGDETEIGERGINLSGGQKARVSLGRACYAALCGASVVVLDDVLSAVDAHVARHITDRCLVGLLRAGGKAVLLATHQSLCFKDADRLLLLEGGSVAFAGTFAAAQASSAFQQTLASSHAKGFKDRSSSGGGGSSSGSSSDSSSDGSSSGSGSSSGGHSKPAAAAKEGGQAAKLSSALTQAEEKSDGVVSLRVYRAYVSMAGPGLCLLIVALAIALNAQQIVVNWWLSRWSMAAELDTANVNNMILAAANATAVGGSNITTATTASTTTIGYGSAHSVQYYVSIYAGLGGGVFFLILLYQLLAAYGGLAASAQIHSRMLKALLGAPLSFFDTTLSGRLLNLFTADMSHIDQLLVGELSGSLSLLFMMLAVLGTVVAVLPYVIVALLPLLAVYAWIQLIYRNSARELKRFDSSTQSPVFNHFAESLSGLSTIRAYRCEGRMLDETKRRIDYNSRFWTKNNFINRWLGLRLDWIGAGLVGSTAIACVLAIRLGLALDPGLVGLVLSYTATLTGLLNWGVRRFSEAELGMVAVERTTRLFACPQESTPPPPPEETAVAPAEWPAAGELRLEDVVVRYRPGLPEVLRGVSLRVPPRTKVGVCGRTGSGKTTLAKSLFRLMELESGRIIIDGLDIAYIDLQVLRSRITMIPQDPTLFAGPLRYSLDPSGKHTDMQLWAALDLVGMKQHSQSMDGGLDAEIAEEGENLSAGQRQLLCMCRALLEESRLLIMDEATSNIDSKTDDQIQTMLKESFRECSVLTIAHRIDTIVWYDRVLVLSRGEVAEYDTPQALAGKAGGEFRALLEEYRKGSKKGDGNKGS